MDLEELTRACCEHAGRLGADQAEAYATRSHELSIQGSSGGTDWVRSGTQQGVGVRALVGGRLGFAYTSDLHAGVRLVARRAVANARFAAPDVNHGLPEADPAETPALDLVDHRFAEATTAEKVGVLGRMTAAATAVDRRVKTVAWCNYSEVDQEVAVATGGVARRYRNTYCHCRIQAVAAGPHGEELGFAVSVARAPQGLEPERAGADAGLRAIELLEAGRAPTGRGLVLLAPLAAAGLVAQLARVLSGDALQTRQSPFHDKLGAAIASPVFELGDDPFLPEAPGSRPFDAEGMTSRRTRLLAGGELRTFLHNTYTARQAGAVSTASAHRTSYRGLPEVAPSNLIVRAGDRTLEELVREAGSGVLLTLLQGTHAVHPYTGAFSVGGSGLLIESGELRHAVREVTVAGTFGDLLRGVVATGSDATIVPDRAVVVTPTIAVEGLTTAGA